ncbi:methyl-accepting chemotaxis protein [Methylomonas sp. SURF-1]|uniref:Methyl-accepting chemotaxis protein n=1 Tax=Methylomonas aurea TaxID=2952224 RepID=A0ABT1UHW7_9GAMM|nr:methyl-accepting chemotaxis protein [Methylomonas sp. SURF-1]MCQ8181831.1 methyl-accepting chemotaxis protein [Methylomonas sp. SURF-1]
MLKDLTIKTALTYIALALFAANLLFLASLWIAFSSIDDSLTDTTKKQDTSDALSHVRFHVVQIQQFLTDVGATHTEDGFADAEQNLAEAFRNLDEAARLQPNLQTKADELKTKIRTMYDAGVKMGWDYIKLGNEAGTATMKAPVVGLDDTAESLTMELSTLTDQLDRELALAKQKLSTSLHEYSASRIAFSIALLLFVVTCLALLYFKIEPPLNALQKSLEVMKQGGGDLTRRIPHEGRDEIGSIVKLFNEFLSMLHGLMRQVAMESEQLTSSSNRLSQMSERVQQDIFKSQMGANQVATTVTELSATVTEVSNNTHDAAQTAQQSSQAANNGKAVVTRTVHSIHALSNNIDRASQVIGSVEHDCVNVSSVLDVIQSIADQTNLLALNAAIEAARAGEQGRGFAVVADEVRTLASRTQESTHEIQAMIEKLQQGSRQAVKAMTESQTHTKETVAVIESTGTLLDDISAMVERISEMNAHISDAVKEQKIVVEHINQNVIAINEATVNNTADAEQTAREAHHLQDIAGNLQKAISQFRL